MKITVKNQIVLDYDHPVSLAPIDPAVPEMDIVEWSKQMFGTPLANASSIVDDSGNAIDDYGVAAMFADLAADADSPDTENDRREILTKSLVYAHPASPLRSDEIFIEQMAVNNRMALPTPTLIYTIADDIVPTAKAYVAGIEPVEKFIASIAFAKAPRTLGICVKDATVWDRFVEWASGQLSLVSSQLSPDAAATVRSLLSQKMDGELTLAFSLRTAADEGFEANSFQRVIHWMLFEFARLNAANMQPGQLSPDFGIAPFSAGELLVPTSVVVVNANAHATASLPRIAREWAIIANSLLNPPKVLTPGQMTKLDVMERAAQRASMSAAAARMKNNDAAVKAKRVVFRKKPPTTVDLVKFLKFVLKKMSKTRMSQNPYKEVKSSFRRANRRDPDDFNRPGTVTSTKYNPDIHVYVDTSGSISQENYQDAISACIKLAMKLNVNLYFSSFSHYLSPETLLKTSNKTVKEIYKEFERIPKVTGGTDFSNVWSYIEASKQRQARLNLIITDFEYWPPHNRVSHPKNLYYYPVSKMNYSYLVSSARDFVSNMRHIDPNVRSKIFM